MELLKTGIYRTSKARSKSSLIEIKGKTRSGEHIFRYYRDLSAAAMDLKGEMLEGVDNEDDNILKLVAKKSKSLLQRISNAKREGVKNKYGEPYIKIGNITATRVSVIVKKTKFWIDRKNRVLKPVEGEDVTYLARGWRSIIAT